MKTACLALALLLSGCAAFDAPPSISMIVPAGSSVCVNTSGAPVSAAKCEELDRVIASLNTPEQDRLVCAAQASVGFVGGRCAK